MNITVIGAGYVGLVTAVCFSQSGHQVICLEKDKIRCQTLEKGQCTILEDGLPQRLTHALAEGTLQFTTEAETAIPWGDFVFIAVGTPEGEGGQPDLSALLSVASEIGRFRREGQIIVIKSTVPPGATQIVRQAIFAERSHAGCTSIPQIVCNPEFLREGTAVNDFLSPDRVVVGAEDQAAGEMVCSLYRSMLRRPAPVILTTPLNAELIKYASNSYLAVRLSYVNELAALCEKLGGDINEVTQIMGLDHRIGRSYLSAGLGYGGACLPKDTQALACVARNAGTPLTVLECAIKANQTITDRLADRVTAVMRPGGAIAVWGLSFKVGTEDVRNSPVLSLLAKISRRMDYRLQIFDPANHLVQTHYPKDISERLRQTPEESLSGADALIIGTAWPQFKEINMDMLSAHMRGRMVFDFVNILNKDMVQNAGFDYYSCGKADNS